MDMIGKRHFIMVLCLILASRGFGAAPVTVEIVEDNRIWDKAPHNAFTDLVRWQDAFYCAFREGRGHVSTDGRIRILESKDAGTWASAAVILLEGYDLRDAHLSVTPDGRLMLLGGAAPREKDNQSAPTGTFVSFSTDGRQWTEPQIAVKPGRWLWCVTWHKGKAYGDSYTAGKGDRYLDLLVSDDGIHYKPHVPRLFEQGYPTEVTLRFDSEGTCYALVRRDRRGDDPSSALLGISRPNYKQWQWKDLGADFNGFGGPNLIRIPGGFWLAAGRMHDGGAHTALCYLDVENGVMTRLAKLPSGGDTSYPGMAWHNNMLYVSYYSSHEGKTSIYLAKLKVTPISIEQIGDIDSPTILLSAKEILTSYERSLAVMREKVSFTAELEQILNGAFTYKAKKYKHRRIVHRDGTRFGLSRESKHFDDQNKMIGHNCLTSIYDDEKVMITQNSYGQPLEHLRIDFRPKSFADRFLANLGTGRLLDGITYGAHNKTFFEVMSEAHSLQLGDEMEIVDGHKTYVLEAETKYGKHILWIDPEYGFNARRMAIHKVTGDYDFDTKLGDQPRPLPPNVNPAVPWCATVKSDLTVDNIKIEKIDGRYVPISAKIRDYEEFENGQFTEVISNYERRDIDFNPDFDAMVRNFLEEVPDETKVYVYHEQSSTATYKWQKGQVVDFRGRKVDYRPKKPQSLLSKPLPSLEDFGVGFSDVRDSNSIIVICFWDMNQRPSRNCIMQLVKKVEHLKDKGVTIVAVQASKVDDNALNEWIKVNNIPFQVGMIQDDDKKTRFNWGVTSQP
ncbi:MAG: redoxin domain-containing protein, partial [Sedimentisphaerales bacterium]